METQNKNGKGKVLKSHRRQEEDDYQRSSSADENAFEPGSPIRGEQTVMRKVGDGPTSTVACRVAPNQKLFLKTGAIIVLSKNAVVSTQRDMFRGIVHGGGIFLSTVRSQGGIASCIFGPSIYGDVQIVPVTSGKALVARSFSFLAHTEGVEVSTKLTGNPIRAAFGAGAILQKYSGDGHVCLQGMGGIGEIEVEGSDMVRIDNDNILAFSSSLDYEVEGAGAAPDRSFVERAWTSLTSGEGIMLNFSCRHGHTGGKVYYCTRPSLEKFIKATVQANQVKHT